MYRINRIMRDETSYYRAIFGSGYLQDKSQSRVQVQDLDTDKYYWLNGKTVMDLSCAREIVFSTFEDGILFCSICTKREALLSRLIKYKGVVKKQSLLDTYEYTDIRLRNWIFDKHVIPSEVRYITSYNVYNLEVFEFDTNYYCSVISDTEKSDLPTDRISSTIGQSADEQGDVCTGLVTNIIGLYFKYPRLFFIKDKMMYLMSSSTETIFCFEIDSKFLLEVI